MRDVPIAVTISPIYWADPPVAKISINSKVYFHGEITEETTYQWVVLAEDVNRLEISLMNKQENDTQGGKDKAIIIRKVSIEDMSLDSFLRTSRYEPEYSPGFYSYASDNNLTIEPVLYGQTYLGFGGVWSLEFTWPVFQWIYQTETNGQGWIYEINI